MKASFKGVLALEYTEGLTSYDWDRRHISLTRLILRIDGGQSSCIRPAGGVPSMSPHRNAGSLRCC